MNKLKKKTLDYFYFDNKDFFSVYANPWNLQKLGHPEF